MIGVEIQTGTPGIVDPKRYGYHRSMDAVPGLHEAGRAVGDPTRAAMLSLLLGGKALPATELAAAGGVTAQTASFHLKLLLEAGLVRVERFGRHRYYSLASGEVATALEALNAIARPVPVRSLRQSDTLRRVRDARTCYDHLAGRLGVAVARALEGQGTLTRGERDFEWTPEGRIRLEAWGLDVTGMERARRRLAPLCLDWTERTYHVAGALGAALYGWIWDQGWVVRGPDARSLRVTESGEEGLRRCLDLNRYEAMGADTAREEREPPATPG